MFRAIGPAFMTLALAAVLPSGVGAQSPSPAFPLAAGTYWVYKGSSRIQTGDGSVDRNRESCRMEITRTIRRGDLTVAVVTGYPDGSDEADSGQGQRKYLIVQSRAGDFYFIDGVDPDQILEVASDPASLSKLLLKDPFLVLEFPLTPGKTYAPMDPDQDRDDSLYAWHVDSRRRTHLVGVRGVPRSWLVTRFQIAFRTFPDHEIIEFAPGIGITRYTFSHHGAVEDVDMRLVEFHRAVGAPHRRVDE